LYTFIINIVSPALVSGIIIDTFAQQREMKDGIESDVRDRYARKILVLIPR